MQLQRGCANATHTWVARKLRARWACASLERGMQARGLLRWHGNAELNTRWPPGGCYGAQIPQRQYPLARTAAPAKHRSPGHGADGHMELRKAHGPPLTEIQRHHQQRKHTRTQKQTNSTRCGQEHQRTYSRQLKTRARTSIAQLATGPLTAGLGHCCLYIPVCWATQLADVS